MFQYFLFIFLLSRNISFAGATIPNLNLVEYQELCKFIQILETNPETPKVGTGAEARTPLQIATELVGEISLLSALTLDETAFNLLAKGEEFKTAASVPAVKAMGERNWDSLLEAWKSDPNQNGDGALKRYRPANQKARSMARERINQVLNQAQTIESQVKKNAQEAEQALSEAKWKMLGAVYGETVAQAAKKPGSEASRGSDKTEKQPELEPTLESFSDRSGGYEQNCGGDGSGVGAGAKPGISILNDMTCICAAKEDPQSADFCGTGVIGVTELSTSFAAAGLVNTAKKFKEKCADVVAKAHRVQLTPEALHGIVNRFKALLGKNAISVSSASFASSYQQAAAAVLGAHTRGNQKVKCEGTAALATTAAQGICVNYGPYMSKNGDIPWIRSVLTAEEKLREAADHFHAQVALLGKLDNLKRAAEIYYELAREASNESATAPTPRAPDVSGVSADAGRVVQNQRGTTDSSPAGKLPLGFITVIILMLAHY